MSTVAEHAGANAERILAALEIPSPPATLLAARRAMESESPDMRALCRIVAADVGLASAMLRTVNAACFAPRTPIPSVDNAVRMLGSNNVLSIVAGIAYREAMNARRPVPMPRYWDASRRVASLCASLARRLQGVAPDEAYTLGLFHDCGIPLLAQEFSDYKRVLSEANVAGAQRCTELEQAAFGIDHATVGYHVCMRWGMPEMLAEVVAGHHDTDHILGSDTASGRPRETLLAILKFADHVEVRARGVEEGDDPDWSRCREAVLDYLGFSAVDCEDMQDALLAEVED